MRSHSAMSQYLPTRFQTSAAGRFTAISSGITMYVGLGTASGGGGVWA